MKTICNGMALMLSIVLIGIKCAAQDDGGSLLMHVAKENAEAVNAIAMYPTETRKIIFTATEYPEIIAKLNAMQKNSQDAFEKLISSFNKEEQEKIWNLTRYNGLIADLASDHKKSEDEISNILVNYPEEVHKTASEEEKNHFDLLVQIDKMNKSYDSDFELLMSGYPPDAVSAFRELIKMPEVLEILYNHMQYTVVVGDYYKKNPEKVLHKTDSINLALTQKNAQEAKDWTQSMNDNPQAQKEYVEATQEYARGNGYQQEDYNAPLTQDVTNYNTNPYNWWFGYPSWYPYAYWNPYPYWYDWGYYYGANGQLVFFGLPSAYFMDWYFYYPQYCYRYPELSNHYYNYYNRHRESMNYNSISHSVNNWRNRNKNIVDENWDKDNSRRTQRFKEFGKMEMNRQKYNTRNPGKQIDQTEYVQEKKHTYPILSEDVSKRQVTQQDPKTRSVQEKVAEPVKKPVVVVPDQYKATRKDQLNNKPTEQNVQKQNKDVQNNNATRQPQPTYPNPQPNNNIPKQRAAEVNEQQKNPVPVKQTENSNQIRDARQYHQNTWEQIQPKSQPAQEPRQQNVTSPPKQQEIRQVEQPVKQNTQPPSNTKRK